MDRAGRGSNVSEFLLFDRKLEMSPKWYFNHKKITGNDYSLSVLVAGDGTGRSKIDIDNGGQRVNTALDCGVVMSGQEMPTADIALAVFDILYICDKRCIDVNINEADINERIRTMGTSDLLTIFNISDLRKLPEAIMENIIGDSVKRDAI